MEVEQELEWKNAHSLPISVDLLSAAKKQLKFLAAVNRNRWLYESPGVNRAIYRYNAFWIPLLAKHIESPFFDGPLVVPFDCEWIWHCHRLNPGRYKSDCEKFYGNILDNKNVISSLERISRKETEEIWKIFYSSEPFEWDINSVPLDDAYDEKEVEKFTDYDLISAALRQSPFFYQVSRPYMIDHKYLEGAVARYKGFLYLIKRNQERFIKSFSVPTYDIDLIWHTHQLYPESYCKDLLEIMGKVLDHDDTDSDRTKGQKLDVGFSATTKMFEGMYGARYWRAGAMYRGNAPSPVRTTPFYVKTRKVVGSNDKLYLNLPRMTDLEVMLEFVGVKNLPEEHKGSLSVSFSKSQPDAIFNVKRNLTVFSETGEKQVASFRCQPTGHLLFELFSYLPSTSPVSKPSKSLGITSISMEDFLSSNSNLIIEKWMELTSSPNIINSKPICLRMAISVTVPTPMPYVLHMATSCPFSEGFCLFPLAMRIKFAKIWKHVTDEDGNSVMSLRIRTLKKAKRNKECKRRELVGRMASGETFPLARFSESEWSLVNSPWSIQFPDSSNDDGHLLELNGPRTVRLFPGRRLDYESKCCEKHKGNREIEHHLVTAVEFSEEDPYGRDVALLDLKSGTIKIKEEWFLLPCFIIALILADTSRMERDKIPLLGGDIQ